MALFVLCAAAPLTESAEECGRQLELGPDHLHSTSFLIAKINKIIISRTILGLSFCMQSVRQLDALTRNLKNMELGGKVEVSFQLRSPLSSRVIDREAQRQLECLDQCSLCHPWLYGLKRQQWVHRRSSCSLLGSEC